MTTSAATIRTLACLLRDAGLALALVPAALLALVTYDPFPGWGTDPVMLPSPIVGLGPAGLAQSGTLMLLGAVVYLLGLRLDNARNAPLTFLLMTLGGVGVMLHVLSPSFRVDDLAIGACWVGGAAAACVVAHAASDPPRRRLITATLASVALALIVKGGFQVLIEHPRTVAQYRATRDAFLASQGWEPGSSMAAAFERRLFQTEASAWFGLANVYSTFAAWAFVFVAGLAAGAFLDRRRQTDRTTIVGLIVGLLITLGGLALGSAKGGYAAAGLGIAIAALVVWLRRRQRPILSTLPLLLALAVVIAPILAVIARGLLGERLAERSLLFRWFYLQGATRIIADHPLAGVGPAGFKDAYILAKPPLSPEEVTSPHSLLFDWAACLGLFGLPWAALLLILAIRAARGALAPDARVEAANPRMESALRLSLLGGWLALLLVAVGQESASIGPEALLARVCGAVAAIAVGLLLLRVLRHRPAWGWACAPAALAVVAHAQVEMTGAHPTSAPLLLVTVGLAAAGADLPFVKPNGTGTLSVTPRAGRLASNVLLFFLAALFAGFQARSPALFRWQSHVEAASRAIAVPTDLLRRLAVLSPPPAERGTPDSFSNNLQPHPSGSESIESILRDARALDPAAPADPRQLAAWLENLRNHRLADAREGLERALAIGPRHWETLRAASRLAALESRAAEHAARAAELQHRAVALATRGTDLFPRSPQAWTWLATVHTLIGETRAAISALERAATLDPHGLTVKVRLANLCAQAGHASAAGDWARRALETDQNLRLDPLRRLSDSDRAAMMKLASGP